MGTRAGLGLTLVTNIPTPYRNHSFAALDRLARRRGIDFTCLFMAATERGRYWKVDPSQWSYRARIVPGLHPRFKGAEMHLNPGILWEVLRRPPAWLIVAGGWALPTSMALLMTKSLYARKTRLLFWAEANYHFSTYSKGPYAWLRRKLLSTPDALVIPGEIARITLQDHWNVRAPSVIYYPNLIDEARFRDGVGALRADRRRLRTDLGIPEGNKVLFWSARLEERTKGILNFLEAFRSAEAPGFTVLLAGDGPDRARIEAWIAQHAPLDVRLLGHIPEQRVLECLAAADAAILPSLRDPNPLSVIEALWSGLPVLISTHCGNWPEAVKPGENGWVIDPENPASMRDGIAELGRTDADRLCEMGRRSRQIAEERFATEPATERLLDGLEAMTPRSA